MKVRISNGNVVLNDKIVKTDILLKDGVIKAVNVKKNPAADEEVIDASGKYILPGFIDIHTNGMAGYDTTNGKFDVSTGNFSTSKNDYNSALEEALKNYLQHGTTLVGLTTLEAPVSKLKKVFNYVGNYKSGSSPLADVIFGIYMEGTFMKDENYKGAHNPKYFISPSVKLFKEFQEAAKGTIKIVNVVPEWGSAGLKLIRHLRSTGVIAAMGHTGATADETGKAIENGASIGIHLFNGPSLSSYKPFGGGGAVEAFIKSDDVFVELISDGYHIDKSYLLDVIKRKGIDKSVIITDGMFTINKRDIKEFVITGVKVKVSKNKEYLMIAENKKKLALAGSSLTMDKAFENLVNWYTVEQTGVWNKIHKPLKLDEAILTASKLCSDTPAKALKVFDKSRESGIPGTGSIAAGKKANVVIADISRSSGKYKCKLEKVFLNGIDSAQL